MILNRYTLATIAILLALMLSCKNDAVVTRPAEPDDPDTYDVGLWSSADEGLRGGFGSVDVRYSRSIPPQTGISEIAELCGWKGERLNAQLVYWSIRGQGEVTLQVSSLRGEQGEISATDITAGAVKYLLTDEFMNGCGARDKNSGPVHLVADIIDTSSVFALQEKQVRPVWISVNIPFDAKPGIYSGEIIACTATDTLVSHMAVRVQNLTLPPPSDWRFHLDLWQNPYAVARFHNVTPWSQEHMDLMKPLLSLLAESGQKVITTTINERPWGGQTEDPFKSMITWIRNSDGSWEYDYSIFDQFVRLAMECGINGQINCYSMVPWGNRLSWFEQDSSRFIEGEFVPGTDDYKDMWRPFLLDFKAHLLENGWLGITHLALDERGEKEMGEMFLFLTTTAPEFRIAMAGLFYSNINARIDDFSYNLKEIGTGSALIAKERGERGQVTTYYVCCSDEKPNNFTFSPPAESCYQGWYSAAMGFDGFLRWAYNSWTEDPVNDSRFRTWPAGDTYMVYPHALSSIRFERLREGIQDYEKIRIIGEMLASDPSMEAAAAEKRFASFLAEIANSSLENRSAADIINEGKKLADSISEIISR